MLPASYAALSVSMVLNISFNMHCLLCLLSLCDCRKIEEDVDPEQIRKDMERLELIKNRR